MILVESGLLLEGVIVPTAWNDNGEVTNLAINCSCGREYSIVSDIYSYELTNMFQKMVRIEAALYLVDGVRKLKVHSFQRVNKNSEVAV